MLCKQFQRFSAFCGCLTVFCQKIFFTCKDASHRCPGEADAVWFDCAATQDGFRWLNVPKWISPSLILKCCMFFEMLYFVESFVRFYNIRLLQCPLILAGVGLKLTLGYGSLTSGCQLKNRQPCKRTAGQKSYSSSKAMAKTLVQVIPARKRRYKAGNSGLFLREDVHGFLSQLSCRDPLPL